MVPDRGEGSEGARTQFTTSAHPAIPRGYYAWQGWGSREACADAGGDKDWKRVPLTGDVSLSQLGPDLISSCWQRWEHPEGQGQHVPRGLALGSGMRARPPLELDRVSLIPSLMLLDHCPGPSFACGEGGVETMLREAQWS